MSKIKLDIESPYTGLHVDFVSPCDSTQVEGLQIGNDVYSIVNTMGASVTGMSGIWVAGAILSAVLDVEKKRAYLTNHITISVSKTATFSVNGWSESAPFTQTVAVDGILVSDDPFVDLYLAGVEDGTPVIEAWAVVGRVATNNGSITAYCYEEKPEVDIPVILKVVR